jgi:hypothetical protein
LILEVLQPEWEFWIPDQDHSEKYRYDPETTFRKVRMEQGWRSLSSQFYDCLNVPIHETDTLESDREKAPFQLFLSYTFRCVRWGGERVEVISPQKLLSDVCRELTRIDNCRPAYGEVPLEQTDVPFWSLDSAKAIQILCAREITIRTETEAEQKKKKKKKQKQKKHQFSENATFADVHAWVLAHNPDIVTDVQLEVGSTVVDHSTFVYRVVTGSEISVRILPTWRCNLILPNRRESQLFDIDEHETIRAVIKKHQKPFDLHEFICRIGEDPDFFLSVVPRGATATIAPLPLSYGMDG